MSPDRVGRGSVECRLSVGRISAEIWAEISNDTIGRVSAEMSVEYRPALSVEYRPSVGWDVGGVLAEFRPGVGRVSAKCRWSVGGVSAEYRPTLSVECRWSIGRDIDWHLGRYSTNILHLHTRPILDRHLGRHLGEISTDTWASYWPTLSRASVEMFFKLVERQSPLSVDTWSVCRSTFGRHLDQYTRWTLRPTLDQLSVDILPESWPRCRSSIGRDVGR